MEELGLSFDNILGDDEISSLLFEEGTQEETPPEEKKKEKETEEEETDDDTAEVDPDNMFGEPESVGSEEDIQGNMCQDRK